MIWLAVGVVVLLVIAIGFCMWNAEKEGEFYDSID
jgi:hypothetical protein